MQSGHVNIILVRSKDIKTTLYLLRGCIDLDLSSCLPIMPFILVNSFGGTGLMAILSMIFGIFMNARLTADISPEGNGEVSDKVIVITLVMSSKEVERISYLFPIVLFHFRQIVYC